MRVGKLVKICSPRRGAACVDSRVLCIVYVYQRTRFPVKSGSSPRDAGVGGKEIAGRARCVLANKRERVHTGRDVYTQVGRGGRRRRRKKRNPVAGRDAARRGLEQGLERGRSEKKEEGEEARKGGENKLLPRQCGAQWGHLLSKLRKIITFAWNPAVRTPARLGSARHGHLETRSVSRVTQ